MGGGRWGNLWIPTFDSFSLGDANNIHHLILTEDICYRELFLKVGYSPINLVSNAPTIELNFHYVSLLLPLLQDLDLQDGLDPIKIYCLPENGVGKNDTL